MFIIEALSGQRIDLFLTPFLPAGTYHTGVNLSTYYNGIFFLVYRLNQEIHIETILKT